MDSFVMYNVSDDKVEVNENEERGSHNQTISKDNEDEKIPEKTTNKANNEQMNKETKKVRIPYCVFNLS